MKLVPKTIDPRVQASVCGNTVIVSNALGQPLATIDAATWAVFQVIDGHASIPDIAARLDRGERDVWRAIDTLCDANLIERLAPPAARPAMMRRDFVRAAAVAGGSLALMASGPMAAAAKSAQQSEQDAKSHVKAQEQANKKSQTADAAKEQASKKSQEEGVKNKRRLVAQEQAQKASVTGETSASASGKPEKAAAEQKKKLQASHAQESKRK